MSTGFHILVMVCNIYILQTNVFVYFSQFSCSLKPLVLKSKHIVRNRKMRKISRTIKTMYNLFTYSDESFESQDIYCTTPTLTKFCQDTAFPSSVRFCEFNLI